MQQTVLVLGASGRFGRHAADAFQSAGWAVRRFDRRHDDLGTACQGVDVIVNGWNPQYYDWATTVPGLHQQVIAAAADCGATVIVPGNLYVFGQDTPGPWSGATPHLAQNPLGRIRIDMEEAYRRSAVRTIILRSGDFIDTCASGNWFDMVLAKQIGRDRFVYPGDPCIAHSWAFLPDVARAAVALAEMRFDLPRYADIPFPGYTVTGTELAHLTGNVIGRALRVRQMQWWPVALSRPVWRLAPHLLEMRYLWNTPHSLDGAFFNECLPGFDLTPLHQALMAATAELPGGSRANRGVQSSARAA